MRCVVTGASGFIGRRLAKRLDAEGHDVVRLDLRTGFDITRPTAAAVALQGQDWVFHLAAIATTPECMRDPLRAHEVNATGTLMMLEAAAKNGIKRFVQASSNVVYGAPTPYWASKLAGEHYAEVYGHLHGLSIAVLRFANTYGSPWESDRENFITSMHTCARQAGYVFVSGDGTQSRDVIHVDDVTRACVLAAQSDYTGEPLDICTGTNRTVNEIADMFGVPVRHVADRPGDIKHIWQDPGPAEKVLGFAAEVPFDEGMKAYL